MHAEVREFGEFAEAAFNNHLLELYTRYKNRELSSEEIIVEAYKAHRKILDNELDQKINSLVADEDPGLRERLISIKKRYQENLIWNKRTKAVNNN